MGLNASTVVEAQAKPVTTEVKKQTAPGHRSDRWVCKYRHYVFQRVKKTGRKRHAGDNKGFQLIFSPLVSCDWSNFLLS